MKIGDEVICIKRGQWKSTETKIASDGPKYNEHIIIDGIDPIGFLIFNKYETEYQIASFDPKQFRKPATHPDFKSEISKKLAGTPLIKEGLEKVKEKELETV